MTKMEKFKSWKEIRDWAEEHGFNNMAKRMDLNNKCWKSSGEFGRNQVLICDAMRFAEDEEERMLIAEEIDKDCEKNYGLFE